MHLEMNNAIHRHGNPKEIVIEREA